MIAKAKAVAHSIRAMLYVSGESRNKKHPVYILTILTPILMMLTPSKRQDFQRAATVCLQTGSSLTLQSYHFFFLIDSPWRVILCDEFISLSIMASAMVFSVITSYHFS